MDIFYLNKAEDKLIHKENPEQLPKDKLVWIRLVSPSVDQMEAVSHFSKIPVEEFTEFLQDEERARLDFKGYLQIIYQAPITDDGEVTTEAVGMFIHRNAIVTTERESVTSIDSTCTLLKKSKLRYLFKNGPGSLVNHLMDKINDEFIKTLEKIARVARISKSEDIDVQKKMLMDLYNSNVTLSHFNQAIIANLDIINGLRKNRFKQFTDSDREEFTELYHDVLQVLDTEKVQREVVSSIFNFQTVLSSYKLNEFMKKLTVLALIMLIPTLIASIFGMNVHMPFEESRIGFWVVVLFMIVVTSTVFLMFRKMRWF